MSQTVSMSNLDCTLNSPNRLVNPTPPVLKDTMLDMLGREPTVYECMQMSSLS